MTHTETKDWEKEILSKDLNGWNNWIIKTINLELAHQQEQIAKYLEGKKIEFPEPFWEDGYDTALTESSQEIREGKFNQ